MRTSDRNDVTVTDDRVHKVHGGPDGADRAARAAAALGQALAFELQVPEVVEVDGPRLVTTRIAHVRTGAELLDIRPSTVLHAVGSIARQLHALPPPHAWPLPDDPPTTFVHGDLCPVNLLFDGDDVLVGVVDWEDSHIGDPVQDLAWTEWIVRTWHRDAVEALPALHAAYDRRDPDPTARREAMRRCLSRHRARGDVAVDWDRHLAELDDLDLTL